MHGSLEKGIDVTQQQEHPPRRSRGRGPFVGLLLGCAAAAAGLFAAAVAAAPVFAAGAPSQSVLTDALTPALSARPPQIDTQPRVEEIYSTRARLIVQVVNEGHAIEWHAEYSAGSETGPWVAAGGGKQTGTTPAENELPEVGIGAKDATGSGENGYILHHLIPNTTYYVRFVVRDEGGSATKTFTFATLAVGRPEIPQNVSGGSTPSTFKLSGELPTPTSQGFDSQVETNGAETKYEFEYATSAGGPWTVASGCQGTVTVAEDFANPECVITGLTPETQYYARLRATNVKGKIEEVLPFMTETAKPVVYPPHARNITTNSAHIQGFLEPRGAETTWRIEYSVSKEGQWQLAFGGTVSGTEAASQYSRISGSLTGLVPATEYSVRLSAQNAFGAEVSEPLVFATGGPPSATTFAVHDLHGESLRVLGAIDPDNVPTSAEQTVTIGGAPTGGSFTLTFNGQTTTPIAFDASANEGEHSIEKTLNALSDLGEGVATVEGPKGGPYTIVFEGPDSEASESLIVADGSGLTPSGSTVTVAAAQEGGVGYDASYHFEYVSQAQFQKPGGEGGFAEASSTPETDLGTGNSPKFVGDDLPGLKSGETYDYRVVATSTLPGDPVVDGATQTLTAPVAAAVEAQAACPNKAFRIGPSASLPDCRAYEQVTPVEKEGTQELFEYGGSGVVSGALVGDTGDHLLLSAPAVTYGSGPDAGEGPYSFSRDPGKGWQMTAAAPQPETGASTLSMQVANPEMTRAGFGSAIHTSAGSGESKNAEFKAGPPGGPYTTVSVPGKDVPNSGDGEGWVASSADFSKLILETQDHLLLGSLTGTASGDDLYEYSAGHLLQANVGVGACGARIVHGTESEGGLASSSHAVSAEGVRVFFEATPGKACSEPSHLYARVNGTETVDLGAYKFIAANPQGTRVLLEKRIGEARELFLYTTESGVAKPLEGLALQGEPHFIASEDLSTLYIRTAQQLTPEAPATVEFRSDMYRYDILDETLRFVVQTANPDGEEVGGSYVTPDGRYFYFSVPSVEGVLGGAIVPGAGVSKGVHGEEMGPTAQVFRYDSAEDVIQCMSCASPSDSEPKLNANFAAGLGPLSINGGLPSRTVVSANGDFAFFETPAALVPEDVDGEVTPIGEPKVELFSNEYSPSSDVYEWRKDGVDGCAQLQGCLALITSGQGGYLNLLIGATPDGSNVFIYTASQLVAQDDDSAGDIYDVRVDGGFPPPAPRPTECEGAECSTPASAPVDATPSSSTYHGGGNVVEPPPVKAVAKTKKPTSKKKAKKKKKKAKARKKGRQTHAKRAGRERGAK
jgi:hypothetical protein